MTSNFSAVSEETILDWVGPRNFQLGHSYFESRAIVDPRRQGKALKAWCQGSMPQPYRLQASFEHRGVVEADCSCPVGGGGRCKHVGALLLAWLHQPDAFRVVAELDTDLEQRSKPELIALIKQMLRLQPDLETLLEATLPGEDQKGAPVNPDNYRRQVSAAFQRAGDDWYASRRIPTDIRITLSAGDGFLARADHSNASIVYRAVAQGILENYELVQDDDGELCEAVDRCVEGLDKCLASMELDSTAREDVLRALYSIYLFNMDYGGGETEVTAPDCILEHATSEEKRTVAGRIRAVMPDGDSWSDGYRRRVHGRFLLDLENAHSDDATYLEVCREGGLLADLANRLLTLNRLEEALTAAESASDHDILAMAKIFLQHGCSNRIEPLLTQRIRTAPNDRLVDWLKERHKERGELDEALALASRQLDRRPTLAGYQEVRELARTLGIWQDLRPQLLDRWSAGREHYLLTEVHLEEGEIELALESVKQASFLFAQRSDQLIRVAQAASATHPQDALEIYRQRVESLIEDRGRDNYQRACTLLLKVRGLYHQLSLESGWADFIAQLRERNRRLPALMEELNNAGL